MVDRFTGPARVLVVGGTDTDRAKHEQRGRVLLDRVRAKRGWDSREAIFEVERQSDGAVIRVQTSPYGEEIIIDVRGIAGPEEECCDSSLWPGDNDGDDSVGGSGSHGDLKCGDAAGKHGCASRKDVTGPFSDHQSFCDVYNEKPCPLTRSGIHNLLQRTLVISNRSYLASHEQASCTTLTFVTVCPQDGIPVYLETVIESDDITETSDWAQYFEYIDAYAFGVQIGDKTPPSCGWDPCNRNNIGIKRWRENDTNYRIRQTDVKIYLVKFPGRKLLVHFRYTEKWLEEVVRQQHVIGEPDPIDCENEFYTSGEPQGCFEDGSYQAVPPFPDTPVGEYRTVRSSKTLDVYTADYWDGCYAEREGEEDETESGWEKSENGRCVRCVGEDCVGDWVKTDDPDTPCTEEDLSKPPLETEEPDTLPDEEEGSDDITDPVKPGYEDQDDELKLPEPFDPNELDDDGNYPPPESSPVTEEVLRDNTSKLVDRVDTIEYYGPDPKGLGGLIADIVDSSTADLANYVPRDVVAAVTRGKGCPKT